MWKTLLSKSIREIKFVLKPLQEDHGSWRFVQTKLQELTLLNQNTNFSVYEINSEMITESGVFFLYRDVNATEDIVRTKGLSVEDLESIFKEKAAHGLTLEKHFPIDNTEREIPLEYVEARNSVQYLDDGF